MQATLTAFDFENARAIAGSVALHAVAALGLFSFIAAPVEILPQQVIQISMVAPPSVQEVKVQKPVQETVIESEPEKTEISPKKIAVKKEPEPIKPVQEKKASHQDQQVTSPSQVSPVAGSVPDAAPATQMVTTTPSFDASYLKNPAPEYPSQAKRRGMEGVVMLGVLVAEDGVAKSVDIAQSSGFSMLDASALDTVKRWKFVPAKRGNESVEARVMVPIEFRLE
ncbi:MAG: energy transducer TonB [Alphaproteobacteria bacterium]